MIDARRVFDPDAERYISSVEAADGQPLEEAVRIAISEFVVGCKEDNIWQAIRACCVLMVARTLTGALMPLAGPVPTNNNFVSGDYSRKTGLKGNGVNKTIDTGLNHNALAQNNIHIACYASEHPTTGAARAYMGAGGFNTGATGLVRNSNALSHRIQTGGAQSNVASGAYALSYTTGVAAFVGGRRTASADYVMRTDARDTVVTQASQTPFNGNIFVFDRIAAGGGSNAYGDGRLAFYSAGDSIPMALLESRVNTLYNAIAAAIP